MAIVETRDIQKLFGDVVAVGGVSLATNEGEFLVLLGPSGCGKTTLLRMIAGLEPPTSGEIVIGGQVVNDLPPRARKIAMVFQSYALYPHMSVAKNIAFPLKAQGLPRGEHEKRVQKSASMLGIGHLLHRKPRELSGGERQRVALARALVREPAVFLLDEPLSNLDAKLRTTARDELQQFQRQIGTTTIYVTHDQVEAMGLGHRIAVMNEGKVRQLGTPQEVYHDPADTFVATFLGSPPMNLVETPDFHLGFRPESLLPKEVYGRGDELLAIPCRITRLEYLGSDRLVYGVTEGRFEGHRVISKLPSNISVFIQPGERHEFAVPRRELKFFDPQTGLRAPARAL
ncbi:MAG: ATP-binding cassette domain-containing protein [Nitrospinota bacterium]